MIRTGVVRGSGSGNTALACGVGSGELKILLIGSSCDRSESTGELNAEFVNDAPSKSLKASIESA